jgi:HlyD family secretion protein
MVMKKKNQSESASMVGTKPRRKWIAVAAVAVLALGAFGISRWFGASSAANASVDYVEETAEVRTIRQSMTGTGTLKAANTYTVTTLVAGEILEADFEEGDIVEQNAQLYRLDSSAAATNIERSQITLSQAQRSYEKAVDLQYARTGIDGVVHSLGVAVGDTVTAGQEVALVRDTSVMVLKLPFPAQDATSFRAGKSATVTLDGTFETLSGTITAVSGVDQLGTGNLFTRTITIQVCNPGSLTLTQAATATVNGVDSLESALFTYRAEESVLAPASGTVTAVYVQEGSAVSAKDILFSLGGDELDDQMLSASETLRSAELAMQNTEDELERYTISSPIQGTVVEKNYKAGDTVEAGKTLCTIYDLSYLEMTINVDELDINAIEVGQTVRITADAAGGQEYVGTVTRVSVAGDTSQSSDYYYGGTTTSYPVTVRIDETEGLRPGMNANAEIIITEAVDVLSVSNAAIQRGDMVLITADSPSAANALDEEAPNGYVYVAVEIGASDADYVEIVSGLQEGDRIAYAANSYGGGYTA